ncbi:MAG TPA: adenosylcobinamide-phosphate synthase CbiB [Acidimicrobiales bacterium]|jgi:adenosylcobinamide-phosphate synthase|nr:adenosylcobinamide-phosphate synthase CbiB [Acidimicrobiales bacterium]
MVRAVRQRMLGTAAGLLVDRLVGEPPTVVHPVARFGQAMAWLDRRWWRDDRGRGVAYAAVGMGSAAGLGILVDGALPPVPATAVATAASVAGRALGDAASTVGAAIARDDLTAAREALSALVARDRQGLEEKEIVRAVVESVAENSADAIVAPALWACLGGATGVLVHRAANTLDAMVGYRNERYGRFGWASARADDVLAWPAARITALLVALVRPMRAPHIWRAVRRDAPHHPSPNAGVSEAAFAAALGLRLGGPNRYGEQVEVRPSLGAGRPAEVDDIARVVRLSRDVTVALGLLLAAPTVGAKVFHQRTGHTGRSAPTRRGQRKP